jgi:SAM-dependent methyltransferase
MDQQAWNERYRDKGLLWTADPNRFLVEAVDGLEPGTALDLGSGEGRNAVWLAQQGWKVEAIDWSDVALDKGRELARSAGVTVWFTQADLRGWWPPDACSDLAVAAYVQLPYLERHGVWRAASHSLKPGGRLVVIGHDWDNLEHGYGGPQQPEALYSVAEASMVIGEHLEVVRAEQVTRQVETPDGPRTALDNIIVGVKTAE